MTNRMIRYHKGTDKELRIRTFLTGARFHGFRGVGTNFVENHRSIDDGIHWLQRIIRDHDPGILPGHPTVRSHSYFAGFGIVPKFYYGAGHLGRDIPMFYGRRPKPQDTDEQSKAYRPDRWIMFPNPEKWPLVEPDTLRIHPATDAEESLRIVVGSFAEGNTYIDGHESIADLVLTVRQLVNECVNNPDGHERYIGIAFVPKCVYGNPNDYGWGLGGYGSGPEIEEPEPLFPELMVS